MDGIRQSPIHRGSETASACAGNTRHSRYAKPYPRNYLRACGECKSSLKSSAPSQELPPRMRRIPVRGRFSLSLMRTTSAYAENTMMGCQTSPRARNYLRVRGEYMSGLISPPPGQELPPRTRRIRRLQGSTPEELGTTSAYAENTPVPEWFGGLTKNYLRVRGEYADLNKDLFDAGELPPRTRRIRENTSVCPVLKGTTSAYAENTWIWC